MFLTSREEFKDYLSKNKKPFMANFYKSNRTKLRVLVDNSLKPKGGKWSYDDENRKKLPKDISLPDNPKAQHTLHTKALAPIITSSSITAPSITMAPLPINIRLPIVQPCSTVRWPIVTSSPIVNGQPASLKLLA